MPSRNSCNGEREVAAVESPGGSRTVTVKATTDNTAEMKNTPAVPTQAMLMAIPAIAGPTTRVELRLIWPRTTALGSRSRPTS